MTATITPEQIENTELLKTPKLQENKNSGAVFGKEGMSPQTKVLSGVTGPICSELETLRGLQCLRPTEERANKEIELERHRGRVARFAFLKIGATQEQGKVLDKKNSIEELRTSDILFLKQKGVDLSNLLLAPINSDPTLSTNKTLIESGAHKSFIVNFGSSKNMRNFIGAGDIFSPAVNTIQVNGRTGIRMNAPSKEFPDVKRPGYYDIVTKVYIPIYDGDKIEVMNIKKLSIEEEKNAQTATDERFRAARIRDMVDSMDIKGDKWREDFTLLPEDESLIKDAETAKKDRVERKKRYEHLFGMGMTEPMFRQYFGDTINTYAAKYDIPPELIVTLIRQESNFDFNAFNKDSKAFGFGQHVPRWKSWEEGERFIGMDLDQEDPFHQVIATIGYLAVCKKRIGSTDWSDAVVAYHTGTGFGEANLAASKKNNPGVTKLMREDTVEGYKKAAAEYYKISQFSGLGYSKMIQTGDFSKGIAWNNFIGMPAERSENDITLCSRTAQKNARLFGVVLPRGDALNARSGYDSGKLLSGIVDAPVDANVLDVFMTSGSSYGHRCIAIKNKIDGQWYIMDPYISGEKPVLLSAYKSKDKIVNVVAHTGAKVFAPQLLA